MDVKILSAEKNSYQPKEVRIESVKKLCDDVYLFRLKNNLGRVLPGQFVEVSVLGVGEVSISICNNEDTHIELLVKDGGDVAGALCRLKAKDKMLVRGPYGTGFPMEELKNHKLSVIADGLGLGSLRSVIQHVLRNKDNYKTVEAFLGFRSYEDIIFKKDIEEWKKELKVHVVLENKSKEWDGSVGSVTDLVASQKVDAKSKVVINSPSSMIKKIVDKLDNDDTDIYISFEKNIRCGVGKCGHCMVRGKYVCTDGPVFRYDVSKEFLDR